MFQTYSKGSSKLSPQTGCLLDILCNMVTSLRLVTQTQCFRVTVDRSLAPPTPSSFLHSEYASYLSAFFGYDCKSVLSSMWKHFKYWRLFISQPLLFYRSNTSSSFHHLLWDMLSGSSSRPLLSFRDPSLCQYPSYRMVPKHWNKIKNIFFSVTSQYWLLRSV